MSQGQTVQIAVATHRGVEWLRGTVDRFVPVADEGIVRVRVVLDDGRIFPAVHPDACWSVQ